MTLSISQGVSEYVLGKVASFFIGFFRQQLISLGRQVPLPYVIYHWENSRVLH